MNKILRGVLLFVVVGGLALGLSAVPVTQAAPGDLLYRINAGGGATGVWAADNYYNQGSVDTTTAAIDTTAVPADATQDIFQSHRYDPDGGADLVYSFPVPAGSVVDVNLYFAEIFDFTPSTGPGSRVFDVAIEGNIELNDYDVYVAAGNAMNKAVMESFNDITVSADGELNITFVRVTAASMVSAIEVIEVSTPTTPAPDGTTTPDPSATPGGPTAMPTAAPDVITDLHDGSMNNTHPGRPIAIYEEDDGYSIYGIDINTGWGSMALMLTNEEINAAGVPADAPLLIATATNPYNYRPIFVYRLPSGELQVNTYYWDGKEYAVNWELGDGAVGVVSW